MNASATGGQTRLSRRTFLRGGRGDRLTLAGSDAAQGLHLARHRRRCRAGSWPSRPTWASCRSSSFPTGPAAITPSRPICKSLPAVRDKMTVFSGVSHPGVTGAHAAEKCFLTGTPASRARRLSQLDLARSVRGRAASATTRAIPSLVLAMSSENNQTLSFTRSGAPIPAERSPNRLFRRLFMQGRPEDMAATVEALQQERSMLDFVAEQSRRLNRTLSTGRPAAAGSVFHLGARARTAAAQHGAMGTPPPAARQCPAAAGH